MVQLEEIGDAMILISGILLLIIAIIFFSLFINYKRRDYLLLTIGFLAASVQMVVNQIDLLFPNNWESGIANLLAGIFGLLMTILFLIVLLLPDKLSINFEEEIAKSLEDEEHEQ